MPSFFDLPDSEDVEEETAMPRPPPSEMSRKSDGSRVDGEGDYLSASKLLSTAAKIFGVDLENDNPYAKAERDPISREKANWVTLSYLSLSVFLLKQMDKLMGTVQPEEDGTINARRLDENFHPEDARIVSNSLNLLFVTPGTVANVTDLERLITEEPDVDAGHFSRLVLNILKASGMNDGQGLDCIWAAYCTELNHRARHQGAGTRREILPTYLDCNDDLSICSRDRGNDGSTQRRRHGADGR